MSNIIRFPEPRPGQKQEPKPPAANGSGAEILFFTGVRYSRREHRVTEHALRRHGTEKAEA